jgi:hypothetical protein
MRGVKTKNSTTSLKFLPKTWLKLLLWVSDIFAKLRKVGPAGCRKFSQNYEKSVQRERIAPLLLYMLLGDGTAT